MRSRIVVKLFILTTLLCMFILATVFIGHTFFFKQYYAHQKVKNVQSAIKNFEKDYLRHKDDKYKQQKLEQDFYQAHNTWITTLDQNGNLDHLGGFYIDVQYVRSDIEIFADINVGDLYTWPQFDRLEDETFSTNRVQIPLYYLMNFEDILAKDFPLSEEMSIGIYGIKSGTKIIPFAIGNLKGGYAPDLHGLIRAMDPYELEMIQGDSSYWENKQLKEAAKELLDKQSPETSDLEKPTIRFSKQEEVLNSESIQSTRSNPEIVRLHGIITKVHLPNQGSNSIYANDLFLDKIKHFQASILLKPSSLNLSEHSLLVEDYKQNNIQYKVLIKSLQIDGQTSYIFAMTSLQPVDEAVQMVKDYYIYLIIFVMILVLLASFYYSKKIANPLLRINRTTKKIANLDFSESVSVKSRDELGMLSENINTLSETLNNHIGQLQRDIEKEKQLENTRKEFISGVSHELKTPLSIMKSTISILQDNVAKYKRAYYFHALEQEVDKMDRLIVDMLELAKYESGTYQMKVDSFYLDEMIEHVCEQLSLAIAKKKVTIQKDLQPLEVLANDSRIEQVVTNFLTNAIRHTPEEGHIIISIIDEKNQVKVCVENTGELIDPAQIEKIWDRFYRGDTSRERAQGETGLGLAISKNILELHGSKYGVKNIETGVLFYFYLKKNHS